METVVKKLVDLGRASTVVLIPQAWVRQLKCGHVRMSFDPATGTITIISADQQAPTSG